MSRRMFLFLLKRKVIFAAFCGRARKLVWRRCGSSGRRGQVRAVELRDGVLQLRAANKIAGSIAQRRFDVFLDVFLNVLLAYGSIGDGGADGLHFQRLAGLRIFDHSRKFDLAEEVECGAGSQAKMEHVQANDQIGGSQIGREQIGGLERALERIFDDPGRLSVKEDAPALLENEQGLRVAGAIGYIGKPEFGGMLEFLYGNGLAELEGNGVLWLGFGFVGSGRAQGKKQRSRCGESQRAVKERWWCHKVSELGRTPLNLDLFWFVGLSCDGTPARRNRPSGMMCSCHA